MGVNITGILRFTDDIVLIASDQQQIELVLTQLNDESNTNKIHGEYTKWNEHQSSK